MAPENHMVRISIPEEYVSIHSTTPWLLLNRTKALHLTSPLTLRCSPIKFAWQGGVALGNNKTALEQHRITRADYQEHGATWLAKRMLGQQAPIIQTAGSAATVPNKRRRSPG
ncbi:hypothetical protein TWF970_008234 [Orbilia oligospora]|uniref:Uncharacterized protein n=1 Tax=Orbilia oligospora TaxID=2813651 RepID=A0A7C8R6F9_ORBOL|nr:hypothetical protein TWF970_008234 [Orbilia oligospora]